MSEKNGDVNSFTWINDYRLADQQNTRYFNLTITTNCITGDCSIYKVRERSDSEILGYFFRSVDIDYVHKFENDLNRIDLNVDYLMNGKATYNNYKINLETDCFTGSCYLYKLNFTNNNENIIRHFKEFHYDYVGKVVDGLYVLDTNVYLKRPTDTYFRHANLLLKHDCASGRCKKTKIIYRTNDQFLGKNFRYLDADFTNEAEKGKSDSISLKIDYDRGNGEGLRNFDLSVNTNCIVGDCSKYVLDYTTNSEVLGKYMRRLNVQWYAILNTDIYVGWYNITYRRPDELNERKTYLLFESDCQTLKGLCNYYKVDFHTDSEILG